MKGGSSPLILPFLFLIIILKEQNSPKQIDSTEIANEESLTRIWTSVPTSGPDAKHLDTATLNVLGSER